MRAGFGGGVVVDYPNSTKAKKIFLCLFCGVAPKVLPKGLESGQHEVSFSRNNVKISRMKSKKPLKGTREWIESKKERRRRQGKSVKHSSKYTGRKRRTRV